MRISYTGYAAALLHEQSPETPLFSYLANELDYLDETASSEAIEILNSVYTLHKKSINNSDVNDYVHAFFVHYVLIWFAIQGRVGLWVDSPESDKKPAYSLELTSFQKLLTETLIACKSERAPIDTIRWLEAECQKEDSIYLCRVDRSSLYTDVPLETALKALNTTLKSKPGACIVYIPNTDTLFLPKHVALILRATSLIRRRVVNYRDLSYEKTHALQANINFVDAGFSLNEDQQQAVLKALTQKLTIISGGPGTGKTSIIKKILEEALAQRIIDDYSEVSLTAPTGKAAQRMTESLTPRDMSFEHAYVNLEKPCTIHRLLHIGHSLAPRFNDALHLPYKLIIVDEISMIALELGCMLLSAVDENTHLVLLGDPDQLPPVESGSLLHALIKDEARDKLLGAQWKANISECHVTLRSNYRAKSQPLIFDTQNAVIQGKSMTVAPTLAEKLKLVSFEWCQTPDQTASILDLWANCLKGSDDRWLTNLPDDINPNSGHKKNECDHFKQFNRVFSSSNWYKFDKEKSAASLKIVFDHFERFRILTPMNEGRFGAKQLNHYIMRKLFGSAKSAAYLPAGTLVMLTQNNYEIGHFNGDTGIIVLVHDKLSVAFPSSHEGCSFDVLPLAPLRSQLIPAFAISVHKSQGSQYQHVMIFLPPNAPPSLMTRNLLYTAISRASQSASLVGSEYSVEMCITNAAQRDPLL